MMAYQLRERRWVQTQGPNRSQAQPSTLRNKKHRLQEPRWERRRKG